MKLFRRDNEDKDNNVGLIMFMRKFHRFES